ncbi:hypothetical protein KP509_26G053000 [Ceratopteris richardii]|nr:hypothetical protein KP509_26G053000 [Ceratopteris richardii]
MPSGEAHGRKEISSLAGQSPVKEKKLENSAGQASKSSEKPLEAVKKRVHLLNDKKLNPEFFQKLNIKDPEDWQIEVALPQSLPPPKPHYTALSNAEGNLVSDSTILNLSSEARQVVGRKEILKKDLCLNSKGIELHNEESRSLVTNGDFSSGHLSRDLSRYGIDFDRNISKVASLSTQDAELNSYSLDSASTGTCLGTEESKWQVMQEKLDQIEQQQSHLLQMVQEIRVSYQENIMSLKGRLWNLENVVESLLDDLVSSGSKNHKVTTLGVENNELRVSGRYMAGSEYATSRLNMNENSRFLMDKVKFPDTVGNHTMGHNSQEYSEVPVDDWEDDSYRGSLVGPHMFEGQILGRRTNVFTKFEREDSADNHGAVRRLWDRVPGASRLGEGPSARSVWQASKDEATLAAIRVAGEDSELPEIDAHVNTSSQLPRPDLEADKSNCKSGNGHVQRTGRHWNLWSHVLRFVQQGDMESAYTETLFSEDEHMLIKLMNRTGPVLDQLSSTTASEMLHAVGVLLQHQNYFDACLCWIQQVADMVVAGNEPDLDITLDVRKELLMSLQETSNMDLPDGWRGSGIDELLQQLAIAWSLDIEAVE